MNITPLFQYSQSSIEKYITIILCLPSSRGHMSLVIVSTFYVCSALSTTKLTRSKFLGESFITKIITISKFWRESFISEMQNLIIQLESQLYQSLKKSLIGQGDQKSKRKTKSLSQEQSITQTEVISNYEKKSPRCLFKCLKYKHLHPVQCHHLCSMSAG